MYIYGYAHATSYSADFKPTCSYRQKAAAYLAMYVSALPVTVPACMAVISGTYTSRRVQALALLWYFVFRGAASRCLCAILFWSCHLLCYILYSTLLLRYR